MNYLTVYKKDNTYYYLTVSYCSYEVGYINSYDRELISIQVLYNGRYYDFEEHEKIIDKQKYRYDKFKRRYKFFKEILYIFE